ncbi:chemotaxis response regulator protein-glutamate methylesterase [Legionella dresdenensis]|uniref:Protein-glutamate methylesterase/protein-glutamine glutaminase n=1 Tax=Legionella dresdenensis TaxID=450200 RepID=A0ABV8CHX3_9GAMM
MSKIKVMIIDDSALMRRIINTLLSKDPDIEVVGSISNAVYALNMIERLQPDIITLDIEMPGMDGLTALTELRKKYPELPVIMCSSLTLNGATVTLEALNRGANDYVTKPSSSGSAKDSFEQMSQDLLYKIKGLTSHLVKAAPQPVVAKPQTTSSSEPRAIHVLAIGVSTGGPNALTELLPKLPRDFPVPVVIVQHMPPVFTKILAENLSKKSALDVKEAVDGDILTPGTIFIAPGNYHMTVARDGLQTRLRLNQDPPENFCRPAVDVLFRSVAALYGKNTLSVIMTGMGQDGMLGCKEIKQEGGLVIIQDQASSVVWGMPGAVYKEQLADAVYPLTDLGGAIVQCVNRKGLLI